MKEIIFMVENDPEGGYTAEGLGQSIITQGDTLEDFRKSVLDAVRCHFENLEELPKVVRLHFVHDAQV